MKEFTVNANDAGQRLDKFALKVTLSLPKSLLYKAVRTKKIKVNRKRCEANQILREGDVVQFFLPPDFFGEEREPWRSLTPRLSVVYEDENLLICDKETGLSCHSDETQKSGTLIDHIKAYLWKKGEFCPEEENSFSPALCNRIDRNTSGLVICAKNAPALREMNRRIRERSVEKRYLAWVHGKTDGGKTITLYLKKEEEAKKVRVSPVPRAGYLTAVTEYSLVSYDSRRDRSLLRVILHTGRTHQIRASFAFLGHPLVGDSKYGTDRNDPEFSYQALRSYGLCFLPQEQGLFSYLEGREIVAEENPLFCVK